MISEFFVNLGLTIAAWFVGLFPSGEEVAPPDEVIGFDDMLNGFLVNFSGLGVWAPWPLIFSCVALSILLWGAGLIVKAVRAAAAHIPLFGGAG